MSETRMSTEDRGPLSGGPQADARKTYATPRLTRWGTIPRVTQGPDFSGPPPLT